MKTAAFIFLLLAGQAWAGWSMNWPAYEHPGKADVQIAELWTSVVERCQAAGVSEPSAWTYTSQHDNLSSLKTKVVAVVTACVDVTQINAAGNFSDLFAVGVTNFPMLTTSTLCVRANLPTNYFTVTPWSCLSGEGPNGTTNDNYGGIGHPFGWTNASTVAAGTNNLPGSRTTNCWFTTDYGFQGLKDVMAQLLWFKRAATLTATGHYGYAPTASRPTGTSWQDTKDYADLNTNFSQNSALIGSRGSRQWRDERRYKSESADWFSGGKAPQVTGLSTTLWHGAQFYLQSGTMPALVWNPVTDTNTYSDSGLGLTADRYSLWSSVAETTNETVVGTAIGSTDHPSWCDEPPFPAGFGYGAAELGCSLTLLTVTTWDGPNGFQYK